MTRRVMLSIISSICEPIRLISPYLLKGKKYSRICAMALWVGMKKFLKI